MRCPPPSLVVLLVASLSLSSGCGVIQFRRVTRTVSFNSMQTTAVEREAVGPRQLTVEGPRVVGSVLGGRIVEFQPCRRVRTQTVVQCHRRETVYVDDKGARQDTATYGGGEVLLGVGMPLVLPIYVAAESDSTLDGESFVGLAAVGAVVGVGVLVAGLVDIVASIGTGTHEEWSDPPLTRRIESEIEACETRPAEVSQAVFWVDGATTAVALEPAGLFSVELEHVSATLGANPIAPWMLRIPDRAPVEVPMDPQTRIDIAERIGSAPVFEAP